MSQGPSQQHPPDWAFEPLTAWAFLAVAIVLAFTPAFPLNWLIAVVAAIFTYQDRRAAGLPAFWWTAAVLVFGALAYAFYVYRRPQPAVVYSPQAAMFQQARVTRGLPPRAEATQLGSGTASANWYPDPMGKARLRYWDGARWTTHVAD